MIGKRFYLTLIVAACMVLSGCGSGASSRFYRLTPAERNPAGENFKSGISITVGPVTFPRYLERPQIVTGSGSRMRLLELDQWAGSLKDDFTRTLAENLSMNLGTDRVSIFPVKRGIPAEFRVSVNVIRLGGEPGKKAVLTARWNVFSENGETLLHMGRTHAEVESEGFGVDDLVMAQSRAVERMAEEIASVIRK